MEGGEGEGSIGLQKCWQVNCNMGTSIIIENDSSKYFYVGFTYSSRRHSIARRVHHKLCRVHSEFSQQRVDFLKQTGSVCGVA